MALISKIKGTDNIEYNVRDDVSVWGGRNLLKGTINPLIANSNLTQTGWYIGSGGNGTGTIETITDSPIQFLTKSFRITGNTSGNRDWQQAIPDFDVQGNSGQWWFTCWVRAIESNCTSFIRVWDTAARFTKSTSVSTSWTKLSFSLTLTNPTGSNARILFGTTGTGSIEYIGVKLERGNKATDWSPAPEDIARVNGTCLELLS